MVWLFTGRPGAGKSLHAAQMILNSSLMGRQVIANFAIKPTKKQERQGKLPLYWDNTVITPQALVDYAFKHHKKGREGQTLLVIDECQLMFNCRDFYRKDRAEWVKFFSLHRHLGYDVILITQFARGLDKQIQAMAEYEVIHRAVNNFGLVGIFLTIFRMKLFVAVEVWCGVKEVSAKQFFFYKKKLGEVYDSYANFHVSTEADALPSGPTDEGQGPPSGEPEAARRLAEIEKLARVLTAIAQKRDSHFES